jgi:hypothetical protein
MVLDGVEGQMEAMLGRGGCGAVWDPVSRLALAWPYWEFEGVEVEARCVG